MLSPGPAYAYRSQEAPSQNKPAGTFYSTLEKWKEKERLEARWPPRKKLWENEAPETDTPEKHFENEAPEIDTPEKHWETEAPDIDTSEKHWKNEAPETDTPERNFENEAPEIDTPEKHFKTEAPVVSSTPKKSHRAKIIWSSVVKFGYMHWAAIYGVYLMLTSAKVLTTLWAILLHQATIIGITAGNHRLWSHRSYEAEWPLKVVLIIFSSLAGQDHVFQWVKDHRIHHKFTETDADPYNANRGFFFSHVGRLLCEQHPQVIEKGHSVDFQDIYEDPFVMFQRRYFRLMMSMLCFILPTIIPVFIWDETWSNSWHVATMLRYTFSLNVTWLMISATNLWEWQTNEKSMISLENLSVSFLTLGEGWHNIHHVFPQNNKTLELRDYRENFITQFINFFVKIGWARNFHVPVSVPESDAAVPSNPVRRHSKRKESVAAWKDWNIERVYGKQEESPKKRRRNRNGPKFQRHNFHPIKSNRNK